MFSSKFFRTYLMPGFIFQSIVVGGGYGTGRELVEFFMIEGPLGGLMGMTGLRIKPRQILRLRKNQFSMLELRKKSPDTIEITFFDGDDGIDDNMEPGTGY